jgi:sRNA-binding protein
MVLAAEVWEMAREGAREEKEGEQAREEERGEKEREQAREEKEREQAREEEEKKKKEKVKKEEGEEKSGRRKGEEGGPVASSAGVCVGFRVSLGVGLFHHVGEVGVRQGIHQARPSGGRVSRPREEQVE